MVRTRRLQRNRAFSSILSLLLIASFTFIASPAAATGGSALSKLNGKIIVSTSRFPSRFKSDEEMYKHMKKVDTHELFANEKGEWSFEYMAFLPKPVATLQAAISFYDVTNPGTQSLVDTFTFYPSDRTEKILNGYATLGSKFSAERKYLMVFSRGYGQSALSKTTLVLRN